MGERSCLKKKQMEVGFSIGSQKKTLQTKEDMKNAEIVVTGTELAPRN